MKMKGSKKWNRRIYEDINEKIKNLYRKSNEKFKKPIIGEDEKLN